VRLNLSDDPLTAELLAEGLRRTGTGRMAVLGTSMHPTLQMGWRVIVRPAGGADLRPGDIAVFRTEHHLTVHRLVWIERRAGGTTLVFRGDYNRIRERVPPEAVIARVVAIEVPSSSRPGDERVFTIGFDALALFYRLSWMLGRPFASLAKPNPDGTPPGRLGRAARSVFAGLERVAGWFLPQKR
jgi:signal peptidase I